MKRRGLILPSLLGLLVGGTALITAGLTAPPSPPPRLPIETKAIDSANHEAIQRWRAGQPHHWRACMLRK
jgi:hypothetical protein